MPFLLELAISGTGTGVGKTRVTLLLAAGLRARGRTVWLHKPVACGDWRDGQADDGRSLGAAHDADQPIGSVCPFQFPEPASPHLAAAAAGHRLPFRDLVANLAAVRGGHDLLVEGAGGLLTPLAEDRSTFADLIGSRLPLVIVTTPELGTLNHTALTVACARARGLRVLGLVLNRPGPSVPGLATERAASELVAHCAVPLLADLPHGAASEAEADALAAAVLIAHDRTVSP